MAEAVGSRNLREGMRGRLSFGDQYPPQMMESKAKLLQHFEEARSRKPPCTPDQQTLFNTWNSIVKQYNRSQQIIGQPPLKSRRKDGMFSVSCVRNICREVNLEATGVGSREPKDADPKDIEEFVQAVPKLFKEHGIDPRANLQFDEFNDIKGITQRRMVHKTSRKTAQDHTAQGEVKPIGAPLNKHCPQTVGGKKSLSCGFLLSPTTVGRACVLTDT